MVTFAHWLQRLVSSRFDLKQTLTSTAVRWAHCPTSLLATGCSLSPLNRHWASCRHHDQTLLSQPPMLVIAWAGLQAKGQAGRRSTPSQSRRSSGSPMHFWILTLFSPFIILCFSILDISDNKSFFQKLLKWQAFTSWACLAKKRTVWNHWHRLLVP